MVTNNSVRPHEAMTELVLQHSTASKMGVLLWPSMTTGWRAGPIQDIFISWAFVQICQKLGWCFEHERDETLRLSVLLGLSWANCVWFCLYLRAECSRCGSPCKT